MSLVEPIDREDQLVFTGTLGKIVGNFSEAARATLDSEADSLERYLISQISETRQKRLTALAEAISILEMFDGVDFTSLPDQEQRARIYSISTQDYFGSPPFQYLGQRVQQLYDSYQHATDRESQRKSWRTFVQTLGHLKPRYNKPKKSAEVRSFPFVPTFSAIDIPHKSAVALPPVRVRVFENNHRNNSLQTHFARSMGVLREDETWEGFVQRGDTRRVALDDWEKVKEMASKEQGVIFGEQQFSEDNESQGLLLGGLPSRFCNIPTGYSGVQAEVLFYVYQDDLIQPLTDLIKEDTVSPVIRLLIPTEFFFEDN